MARKAPEARSPLIKAAWLDLVCAAVSSKRFKDGTEMLMSVKASLASARGIRLPAGMQQAVHQNCAAHTFDPHCIYIAVIWHFSITVHNIAGSSPALIRVLFTGLVQLSSTAL